MKSFPNSEKFIYIIYLFLFPLSFILEFLSDAVGTFDFILQVTWPFFHWLFFWSFSSEFERTLRITLKSIDSIFSCVHSIQPIFQFWKKYNFDFYQRAKAHRRDTSSSIKFVTKRTAIFHFLSLPYFYQATSASLGTSSSGAIESTDSGVI